MNCRTCGSNELLLLHDFGMLPVAGYLVDTRQQAGAEVKFQSRLVFCAKCGLVQQDGESFKEVLVNKVYSNYRPTYSMSSRVREYMLGFIDEAVSFSGGIRNNDIVLEIGSNDGSMFDILRSKCFRPAGIDPSATQPRDHEDAGIVVRDYFGEHVARIFAEKHGRIKLLYSRHTLEHVFDPVEFMKAISIVLADRGVAVIEVPYLPFQLSGNQFAAMTFQHISFFSYASLSYLAQSSGLTILGAKPSKMDGGSIIIFLGKSSGSPISRLRATEGLLELESMSGVNSYPGLLARFKEIGQSISLIKEYILLLKSKSYRVVGYGAGAKGQALLNMAGLSYDLMPCVIDDTPGSGGMYIPGVGSEVVDSADSRLSEADIVLITAPTHVDEIVAKEYRRHPNIGFIRTSPNLGYVSNF